jgi:hypothetical protein
LGKACESFQKINGNSTVNTIENFGNNTGLKSEKPKRLQPSISLFFQGTWNKSLPFSRYKR